MVEELSDLTSFPVGYTQTGSAGQRRDKGLDEEGAYQAERTDTPLYQPFSLSGDEMVNGARAVVVLVW